MQDNKVTDEELSINIDIEYEAWPWGIMVQGDFRGKVDEPPKPVLAAARRVQASMGTPNASELGLLPMT